jgi:hypothetical protein
MLQSCHISTFIMSVVMLCVMILSLCYCHYTESLQTECNCAKHYNAECCNAQRCEIERHFNQYHYSKYHYAESHFAEFHYTDYLNTGCHNAKWQH